MHGVFSYLFIHTLGLAYPNADSAYGISYVKDLQSSGGNDNICIQLGVVFAAVALLWGGLHLKSPFGVADIIIYSVLVGLQTLFVLSIEMGSIAETILGGKNVVLALWMLSYIALCGFLLGIFALTIVRSMQGTLR